MKVGAEDRTKLIVALVLVVVAAVLVVRWLFAGTASPHAAVAATPTAISAPAAPARPSSRGKKMTTAAPSLDPTLRFDWLKASEDVAYEGRGRNIFRAEIEIPKPVAPPVPDQAVNAPPPGPPPPPPITLKFFGYANHPGERRRVFLEQNGDIFVAHEGDIVDRRYKILRIMPNAVEVEDVLNNNRQSIPLQQG